VNLAQQTADAASAKRLANQRVRLLAALLISLARMHRNRE